MDRFLGSITIFRKIKNLREGIVGRRSCGMKGDLQRLATIMDSYWQMTIIAIPESYS